MYVYEKTTKLRIGLVEVKQDPSKLPIMPWENDSATPTNRTFFDGSIENLRKLRSDESFILFSDYQYATLSIQTMAHGRDIQAWNLPAGQTALYQLLDMTTQSTPTPVCYMRLWPDGYFTTSKVNKTTLIPHGARYNLKFIQNLGVNTPIPAPTQAMNAVSMMHMMSRFERLSAAETTSRRRR